MPPGSGRTLCGDRARCGVETNGDTHIRSTGYPRSHSGATPCVFGSMADASQRNTLEGAALEYPNPSRGGDPRHTTRAQRGNLYI